MESKAMRSMKGQLKRHMAFQNKMQPLLDILEQRDQRIAYSHLMWASARFVPIKELDGMYKKLTDLLERIT